MTYLSKNNFQKLAQHFKACSDFKKELNECNSTTDLVNLIESLDGDICTKLEIYEEDELDIDRVTEWLQGKFLNKREKESVLSAIDMEHLLEESTLDEYVGNSLINEMKLELLLDMIDDVTLAEMEVLHAKYKGGIAPVNQLKLVV